MIERKKMPVYLGRETRLKSWCCRVLTVVDASGRKFSFEFSRQREISNQVAVPLP